ncbi:MAG: ABC transporter substrate-binding protein [Chloroflexi bacterium]|nr:ABC transporter substrate-binding protein [Chloroflexota bacterium]
MNGKSLAMGLLAALALFLQASCGGGAQEAPTPTAMATGTATAAVEQAEATPTPAPDPFVSVPGIVDASNHGWPREVEGLNGRVTIAAQPVRIHTLSLGHDEVTYALLPRERVVAVGAFTKDPVSSNVAELAASAATVARNAEQIVAQSPDLVIASPSSNADLIKALVNVGIPVVQTGLHNDPEGRIQDILLLGYIYGEEVRALELAAEVRARYEALQAVVNRKPQGQRPRVLSLTWYSDKLYTAGAGSTEGSIIEAAGGLNVAAEAGLERNPTTSLEGVIAMNPEVIFVPQPPDSGGVAFREQLLADPALAEVPAIKSGQVYLAQPKFFTTLSFWNIRGAEELAKLLWPVDFANKELPPFSLPE